MLSTWGDTSDAADSVPQETIVQEVLGCFDAYARIRKAHDSICTPVRFSPREEQRAYDDLQRAVSRLRASSRQFDSAEPAEGAS
ncbi:hypothetical protein [Streptomyces sp. NPDC060322]|uniref:hypothetical protein n=1 Tax=Streptomyces sp. NPDC060322 TaxID=3347097 RepID=UPI00366428FC